MDRIPRPSIAQTLDRGLQVLEVVARAGDPVTVAQAATKVGIDRTVAHRLIATLTARGYLHRESDGGYRLGPTCLALASAIADLRTTGRPTLEALAEATGETVQLVILSGREVVFIDGIESKKVLRVSTRTGRLLPAHSTSVGKAWLAALSPGNYEELYGPAQLRAVTDRTIIDRPATGGRARSDQTARIRHQLRRERERSRLGRRCGARPIWRASTRHQRGVAAAALVSPRGEGDRRGFAGGSGRAWRSVVRAQRSERRHAIAVSAWRDDLCSALLGVSRCFTRVKMACGADGVQLKEAKA